MAKPLLKQAGLLFSFALLGFGLGWMRTDWAMAQRVRLGEGLQARGTAGIITEIRCSEKATTMTLETSEGAVRVVALKNPQVKLGDEVAFSCRPGSGLEAGRKDPTCLWATLRNAQPGTGITALFARVRGAIADRFTNRLGQPAAAWAAGLLVGDDSALPDDWRQVFRRTGTTHLTAVSGQNLVYVLVFVAALVNRIFYDRRARFAAAGLAVLVFAALAGSPASALRAVAMYFAGRVATLVGGRPVSALRALGVAVVALVALDPTLLVFDRGFQLSALAVFGIAAYSAPLAATAFRWLPKSPRRWAAESAAATLATAPLIAWMSGQYSLVALPANLAVAPLVGPVTGVSAAFLAASFLPNPMPELLARVAGPLIGLPTIILRWLSNLPFAAVTGWPAILALVLTTAAALVLVWRWSRREAIIPTS